VVLDRKNVGTYLQHEGDNHDIGESAKARPLLKRDPSEKHNDADEEC
jgi:hypothetical protein